MSNTTFTQFSYPTNITLGPGSRHQLHSVLLEAGYVRPFFVIDSFLTPNPKIIELLEGITQQGLSAGVFSDFKGNPTEENMKAGIAIIKEYKPDCVIAIGGGSALDIAKLLGFYYKQTRPIWDFEDIGDYWKRADSASILPTIAIPTTSGTGSEVGRAAVVTNPATQTKVIIFHPLMMPRCVLADPELTVGLPPNLTAWTGLDAFIHCFEAYCAPTYHPLSRGIAIEGMRLIYENLETAFLEPNNITARSNMMIGSIMGGTAFQKGLGGVHAMSHPTGALFDTHHGLTNSVYLPYVIKYNWSTIRPLIEPLSGILGFTNFSDWILAFREKLQIPHTIDDIGVDTSMDSLIIDNSIIDPSAGGNPIPFTKELAAKILNDAHTGNS